MNYIIQKQTWIQRKILK